MQGQPRKRIFVTIDDDMDCGGKKRRVLVIWHKRQPGMWCKWTQDCSGCTESVDGQVSYGPCGCHECGFTGKRRHCVWVPLPLEAHKQAIAKTQKTDSEVKRWIVANSPVRFATLGVQSQLFSTRGVRMVQVTPSNGKQQQPLVVSRRQYVRVARLLALQACRVWLALPVSVHCCCIPIVFNTM